MNPDAALLVAELRDALGAAADPSRAPGMQAYMKSTLPFHGVAMPALRKLTRPLITATKLPDLTSWEDAIRSLWDDATHREERYAALEIAGHRHYRGFQHPDAVAGLYTHLIVTGAWWDLVDAIAPHLVGPIVARHPSEGVRMREWARADDLWLRRAAIICQLDAKADTDTALLTEVVDANLIGSPYGTEFFIRKGIGWALRQYSRTDPDWVLDFVDARYDRLAPLSVREALKHLR